MNVDVQGGEAKVLVEQGAFAIHGFTFFRSVLTEAENEGLKQALASLQNSTRAGVRGLLTRCPEVALLARHERILAALKNLTGTAPFAVRGILFDKTSQANWRIGWHQDLAVSVKERVDGFGFGPWSLKDGVVHAHAPVELLERMLTVRVHLDDADETNGALQVIPGSHTGGKLSALEIDRTAADSPSVTCVARAGDVLVMRPLLLHASAPATAPNHRRVIHIEYAVEELPAPLLWFEHVP